MSRYQPAHMSTSNMEGIAESIQEYSMRYEDSQQAISEMISASKTGAHNVSISRQSKNLSKKNPITIVDKEAKEQQKSYMRKTQESIIEEQQDKENASNVNLNADGNPNNQAVDLGDGVCKIIALQQRFREAMGNQTSNPDVLFDFWKRQRKNFKPSKSVVKNVKLDEVGVLMPSSQRKMLLKMQFQKILAYYPHDVYHTLVCGAERLKKDLEVQQKVNKLNYEMAQCPYSQPKRRNTQQVIDRLYKPKRQASEAKDKAPPNPKQIQPRQKRRIFGTCLQELFINSYRKNSERPLSTFEELYKFWQNQAERQKHNIEWDEYTAKEDIKLFMMQQVEDLLAYYERKLGFKVLQEPQLKKFYLQHEPIQKIRIPVESFKEYIQAYNQVMQERLSKNTQEEKKRVKEIEQKRKQRQLKKFGRPVSATPISVLSKPKTTSRNYGQLLGKYTNDPLLTTILHGDKMKMARKAFEYGIYNLQDQVKTKGRVRPKQDQKYEKTIFKLLNKTFTNKNFFNVKDQDRVRHILGEEDIEKTQNWKDFGPVLQQAMLVKCYEHDWFREALIKYTSRVVKKEFKYMDDKGLVTELMKYLNQLSQDGRRTQLGNLDSIINTSQTIAERTEQIQNLAKKGPAYLIKEKKLFYSFLEEKACEFVEKRIKRQEIDLRKFLNDIFKKAMQDHKQFIIKHFHVVTGEKECPKLLKYQFFRLQKEINPFTMQRDQKSKCHAWIPTKNEPQSFSYKTYNTYSNAYRVDKNRMISKEEPEAHKNSIWGYKNDKAKQREVLMMSFNDAKQCVFHPKISRNV